MGAKSLYCLGRTNNLLLGQVEHGERALQLSQGGARSKNIYSTSLYIVVLFWFCKNKMFAYFKRHSNLQSFHEIWRPAKQLLQLR